MVSPSNPALSTLLVNGEFPETELARMREVFNQVYYNPDKHAEVPADLLNEVDVLFCHGYTGFPSCVDSLDQMPNLKVIQNSATGVEKILQQTPISTAKAGRLNGIYFANAAGGYSTQMSHFVLNYITGLYNSIPSMVYLQRTTRRWSSMGDVMTDARRPGIYGSKTIYGKTFGFLGYGALGREFARACSIFPKARIIAANSEGVRKDDDTFILDGTGDPEGKLPEKFYSTKDPNSLRDFISQCDVLVSSLPSTKQTTGLLDAEKLGWMKPEGIFVNVGRGALITSEEIIKAVDAPGGLFGAAIDVTEPEPLTAEHPIWSHPRIMITPHLSGETEDELVASTTILLANVERLRAGKPHFNNVSFTKGY